MHAFASAGADVPLEDQDAHEAQSHIDNAFASPSEGDRRTNSTELFMTRPASVATSNSTPTPGTSINGLEDVHSSYIGMPVEGQDPASFKTPLKPFDRSTFEATFLQHSSASNPLSSIYASSANISSSAASTSSSSSTSEASTTPAQTPGSEHEDPFFYPLLCENERKRLREFWYLTSGIHDDKALATHLRELLAIVRDLYKFDIAVIQFIDNDRSSSLSPDGWQEACCPRRETACAHTMLLQPGVSLDLSSQYYKRNLIIHVPPDCFDGIRLS